MSDHLVAILVCQRILFRMASHVSDPNDKQMEISGNTQLGSGKDMQEM